MIWTAILVASMLLALGFLRLRNVRSIDPMGMVGLDGTAEETFSMSGMVFVRGELWRATSERGIVHKGQRVRVTAVRPGLLLVVEGVNDPKSV